MDNGEDLCRCRWLRLLVGGIRVILGVVVREGDVGVGVVGEEDEGDADVGTKVSNSHPMFINNYT